MAYDRIFQLRLTRAQRANLETYALDQGITASDLLRGLIDSLSGQPVKVAAESPKPEKKEEQVVCLLKVIKP